MSTINPSTVDELNKMASVEGGNFLNDLLDLATSYFDSTLTHE